MAKTYTFNGYGEAIVAMAIFFIVREGGTLILRRKSFKELEKAVATFVKSTETLLSRTENPLRDVIFSGNSNLIQRSSLRHGLLNTMEFEANLEMLKLVFFTKKRNSFLLYDGLLYGRKITFMKRSVELCEIEIMGLRARLELALRQC